MLPPRHRFFSALDGHWHEVVGDDAAIAILGEDVFLHGPQFRRVDRRPASELDAETTERKSFSSRIIERERQGDAQSDWKVIRGDDTSDDAVKREGKLRDGLDDMTEGVRTLHMVL